MKTDCPFKVVIKKYSGQPGWEVEVVENNYNYEAVLALSALPKYCILAMTADEKAKVRQMNIENHRPSKILISLRYSNPDLEIIPRDIYNLLASLRAEELAGKTPIE